MLIVVRGGEVWAVARRRLLIAWAVLWDTGLFVLIVAANYCGGELVKGLELEGTEKTVVNILRWIFGISTLLPATIMVYQDSGLGRRKGKHV